MRKTGILITLVLLLGISSQTFSQLKLYREHGVEIMGSVELFLERSNFEYALLSYSTSTWITAPRTFSGVVKQHNNWYLLQMSERSVVYPDTGPLRARPLVRQKPLTDEQADSILAILMPDEGMRYTQGELNTLPTSCESVSRGVKGTFYGVSDNPTYYLFERSYGLTVSRSFYAADTYIQKCLPLNPEFKILKGMMNTVQKLDSMAVSTFK
jgi:hypothetical protein